MLRGFGMSGLGFMGSGVFGCRGLWARDFRGLRGLWV